MAQQSTAKNENGVISPEKGIPFSEKLLLISETLMKLTLIWPISIGVMGGVSIFGKRRRFPHDVGHGRADVRDAAVFGSSRRICFLLE